MMLSANENFLYIKSKKEFYKMADLTTCQKSKAFKMSSYIKSEKKKEKSQ